MESQSTLPRLPTSFRVKIIAILHHSYMLLLLRLPLIYAARVRGDTHSSPSSSARSWRDLLPSLVAEWKMLQFVSAALLSAILTIFQFTGAGASTDQIMRTAGFVSFVCAFVGFMCSSLFIIRFTAEDASPEGTSEHTNGVTGARDLEAADTSRPLNELLHTTAEDSHGLWNMGVLVTQPAVWTIWSIITFALFILLFLWSTYLLTLTNNVRRDEVMAAPSIITELFPRVMATGVLLIGIIYLALAIRTLRS